jgi:uncharacterized membrane protein
MGETQAPEPDGQPGPPPAVPPGMPPGAPPWPWPRAHRSLDPWTVWMHRAEELATARTMGLPVPAWLRKTRGERRWPVTVSIVAAIVLQILLPTRLTSPLPQNLMPILEAVLGVALTIANPFRIERGGPVIRAASIALILLISIANAASAVLLVKAILEGKAASSAMPLLASGASIWATNVIAFALWYWEFDRGGPVLRAEGTRRHPDLMFPQMASPELAPPDWEPQFVDYLYLSFTNATAFSPTDVMPLARWAKLTMLVQSAVSLGIGALVIARAINILK